MTRLSGGNQGAKMSTLQIRKRAMSMGAALGALLIALSGCSSGGGGGSAGSPVATPTPVLRNAVTNQNGNGSTTLRIDKLELIAGETVGFTVILRDAGGQPISGKVVSISLAAGAGVAIVSKDDRTDSNGELHGTLEARFGGVFAVDAVPSQDSGLPSVVLSVIVAGGGSPATPTGTGGMAGPTSTPTAVPADAVQQIVVTADASQVKTSTGGEVHLSIRAFDERNAGVAGVRILVQANPSAGISFDNETPTTDDTGTAMVTMTVAAGTSVGSVSVTAAAGSSQGSVPIEIVSGGQQVSTVARVIVQAAPAQISSTDGGSIQLSIFAFDSANVGVPNVRLLLDADPRSGFSFNPQTPVTDDTGKATSTVLVDTGLAAGDVNITASAGDIVGQVPVTIVAGSGVTQPVTRVRSLIVQASPTSISSALGGTIAVTAQAFDENNVGVPGVRLLLDADPRGGTALNPQTPVTNSNGVATSVMTIQPGVSVGDVAINATAGSVAGTFNLSVVSGGSERPVATVVLESDQPTIGTDSGGTASLRARVLDADNIGIPDVNVLFLTEVGTVSPAVEVTCGGQANPCPQSQAGLAQTTLIIPPGAVTRDYSIRAVAGGVIGITTLTVVPGRGGTGTGNPNAAAGEPASLTIGASPTRIQVTGTGGTEQTTVIGRLFDNNNNPLSGRTVTLRVVPDVPNGATMLPLSVPTPEPGATPLPTASRPEKCLEDPGRAQALADGHLTLGVSDRAGFILASLRAGTISGSVTVEACVDSMNADGTTSTIITKQPVVSVAAGPPQVVSVAVNSAFIDNNDGTLLTTVSALVKDSHGNAAEDGTAVFFEISGRNDVNIIGGATTNQVPPCDISQFTAQTGIPVTAQPGTATTCMSYPASQAGTLAHIRAESGGVSNEENGIEDEDFALPPGSVTGVPSGTASARHFSLASQFLNLSGRIRFDLTSVITAFVADRDGNPVHGGTPVRFTTDGGGITSLNTTDLVGRATASLRTQAPIPDDGIAVVTATVTGDEDFFDVDGNGVYNPDVDVFDPATQDQNGDGVWSSGIDIHAQIPVVFSGFTSVQIDPRGFPSGAFEVHGGGATCFDVHVSDAFNNPIVGGSIVRAQASNNLELLGIDTYSVPDSNSSCGFGSPACDFAFCVTAASAPTTDEIASFSVSVDSSGLDAGGNGSVAQSINGVLRAQ